MSAARSGPSLGDIAAGVGAAVGIILAWLYAAGWIYAYSYFDRFRIPLLLVDLPREHFLVYGGLTIAKNPFWASGIAVVLIAVVILAMMLRTILGRLGLTVIAVLTVAVLFILAHAAGIATAEADFEVQKATDYRAYPRVVLSPKAALPAGEPESAPWSIAASGCARLILFNQERIFLIRPVQGAPGLELHTFVFPWEEASALRITDRYESCE